MTLLLKQILTELKAIRGTLGAIYGTVRENDTGEGDQTEIDRMIELYEMDTSQQQQLIRQIAEEKQINVAVSELNTEALRVKWVLENE